MVQHYTQSLYEKIALAEIRSWCTKPPALISRSFANYDRLYCFHRRVLYVHIHESRRYVLHPMTAALIADLVANNSQYLPCHGVVQYGRATRSDQYFGHLEPVLPGTLPRCRGSEAR